MALQTALSSCLHAQSENRRDFFSPPASFFFTLKTIEGEGGKRWFNSGAMVPARNICTEAEFLDVIGIKVMIVYPLAIQSHSTNRFYSASTLSKSGLKRVCSVNIVYGNLKSQNSRLFQKTSTKAL
jgi:hypothetical protein